MTIHQEAAPVISTTTQDAMKRLLLLSLLCWFVGCGGGGPETASVEGVVRLDGKPLTSGMVTFFPKAGRSASGLIQADGTFVIGTYKNSDGALAGPYKVTVTPGGQVTAMPDFDSDRPNRSAVTSPIPVKYSNPEGSGLTFEVKAGEDNHAEFDLVSK
jgi:hypothetical protein